MGYCTDMQDTKVSLEETRETSAQIAATENSMTCKAWGTENDRRFYLRRTNADRTEAGYIRHWTGEDGKRRWKLVITASGKGSRTAEFEANDVFATYKARRTEFLKLKNSAK